MAHQYGVLNKKKGEYTEMIDEGFYNTCPKAVFAAIAASAYINNGINGNDDGGYPNPTAMLAREWVTLYDQGLVDSKPNAKVRRLAETA